MGDCRIVVPERGSGATRVLIAEAAPAIAHALGEELDVTSEVECRAPTHYRAVGSCIEVHLTEMTPRGRSCKSEVRLLNNLRIPFPQSARDWARRVAALINLNRSECVLSPSHSCAVAFASIGIVADEIVPFGISSELNRDSVNEMSTRDLVVCVTGDEAHKNLDLIVQSANGLRELVPSVLVVGTEAALPLPLESLGSVDHRRLAGLYARARCVILPSRLESYGLPYVEASAFGCEIVALPTLAALEIIPNFTHFVWEESPAALVASVAGAVMQESDRAREFEVRSQVADRMSWAPLGSLVAASVGDLIARKSEPPL